MRLQHAAAIGLLYCAALTSISCRQARSELPTHVLKNLRSRELLDVKLELDPGYFNPSSEAALLNELRHFADQDAGTHKLRRLTIVSKSQVRDQVGIAEVFCVGQNALARLRLGNYANKILLRGTTDPREVVLAGSRYKIVDFGQYTGKLAMSRLVLWVQSVELPTQAEGPRVAFLLRSCWVLKPPSKPTFTGTIRLTLIYSPLNALPE